MYHDPPGPQSPSGIDPFRGKFARVLRCDDVFQIMKSLRAANIISRASTYLNPEREGRGVSHQVKLGWKRRRQNSSSSIFIGPDWIQLNLGSRPNYLYLQSAMP